MDLKEKKFFEFSWYGQLPGVEEEDYQFVIVFRLP